MKTQTRGRSKATIAGETQQVNVRFSKQEGSLGLLGVSPRIALLPLCLLAACGDGIVQDGEACDAGAANHDGLAAYVL